jgi:hypothetical protein
VAIFEDSAIIIGEVIDNDEIGSTWYGLPSEFEKGIEHKLMIKVQGQTIEVFIDGILMATDNNYGTVFQSGKFGFTTYNSAVTFDDVSVSTMRTCTK